MKPLNNDEKVTLIQKYYPLARKMAHNFSTRYHRIYADIIEEAEHLLTMLFCTNWESNYDPAQSSEMTWVYQHIYWGLLTYCTRGPKPHIPISTLSEEDNPYQFPAKTRWIDALLHNLGEEATFLLNTILFAPAEIIEDISPTTCHRARVAVKHYLEEKCGWPPHKIKTAWREVEACL